jgi:transcriptional regulator with XRE-family HTH domain
MYSASCMTHTLPQNGVAGQERNSPKWETTQGSLSGTVPVMGNNLKFLRTRTGWTHEEAASALGVSRSQFIKLERGERRMTADYIARAARIFGVTTAQVIEPRRTVPLVGYVGAGALTHLFAEGQGPFDEVDAPDGATEDTVAVEIRGESLGAFFDNWLVFYDDIHNPPSTQLMNRLCVVGLPDGRTLIKKIKRGDLPGYYTLLSQFEPPIYDVEVEWAALVKSMVPR